MTFMATKEGKCSKRPNNAQQGQQCSLCVGDVDWSKCYWSLNPLQSWKMYGNLEQSILLSIKKNYLLTHKRKSFRISSENRGLGLYCKISCGKGRHFKNLQYGIYTHLIQGISAGYSHTDYKRFTTHQFTIYIVTCTTSCFTDSHDRIYSTRHWLHENRKIVMVCQV